MLTATLSRVIEVARATSIAFLRAALASLPTQRFAPARIHGCPVAQVVDYSFSFVQPDTKPPGATPESRD
jgi:hypothetical protein